MSTCVKNYQKLWVILWIHCYAQGYFKQTHTQWLSVSSACAGGLKTEVHIKERGMQYLFFSFTLMFHKNFFCVKASVNLTLFLKPLYTWISPLHRAFRKITSNINQQMHLCNFHLKHLKPLRHVPIFSDHHQGVSSFLARVITYSRFSSFL